MATADGHYWLIVPAADMALTQKARLDPGFVGFVGFVGFMILRSLQDFSSPEWLLRLG